MDGAVVVLDSGSGYLKAGLNTGREPTVVEPQLVGRTHWRCAISNESPTFIGKQAEKMKPISKLSCPLEHGSIVNFSDQVRLWIYSSI